VTFGPVQLVSDFQTPDQFAPPVLTGTGDTPMGAAIAGGLEMVRQRSRLQGQRHSLLPAVDLHDHRWRADRRLAARRR